MNRKNTIPSYHLIEDGDMSGNLTSAETDTQTLDNIGYIVSWDGTSPVGVITVQVKSGDSEWSTLDFGDTISVSGNTGTHVINVNQLPFNKIRLVYTRSSGVGTFQCHLSAKMI